LVKTERAIVFMTEASAIDWISARFDELRSAGLLDAIPALGGAWLTRLT
jgi:hypothetical protein